jgi:phosphoribosylglycinamide formyltransferase-1
MFADTPEALAHRVLAAEHKLYPHALRLVAGGHVRVWQDRIVGDDHAAEAASLFSPGL